MTEKELEADLALLTATIHIMTKTLDYFEIGLRNLYARVEQLEAMAKERNAPKDIH